MKDATAPVIIFGTVNLNVIRSQKIMDNMKTAMYLIFLLFEKNILRGP